MVGWVCGNPCGGGAVSKSGRRSCACGAGVLMALNPWKVCSIGEKSASGLMVDGCATEKLCWPA